MTLILEITKADGSVVTMPIEAAAAPYTAQAGENFRVIDQATGQTPQGLSAVRDGNDLIIDGVPDTAAMQLCDFYIHGDNGCVLTLDGQQIIAPSAVPSVMVAQAKPADATKKAAEDAMKKEAETTAKPEAVATPAPEAAAAKPAEAAVSEEAAAAAANPAFSASTIALGALAVVGLAAAAGGGSDSPAAGPAPGPTPGPGPAPMAPPAPTAVTSEGADDEIGVAERLPNSSTGETGSIDFSGMAEAGSTVSLVLQDSNGASAATGTTTAAADGSFTVSVDPTAALALNSGTYTPVITAQNATGVSAAATANNITLLPVSPNTVNIEGGDTSISLAEAGGGLEVSGVAEPGSSVAVVMTDSSSTVSTAPVVVADATTGAFTAVLPGVDALTGGSYTVTTTTTGSAASGGLVSDFPNNTGVTTEFLVSGVGDTVVGGAVSNITGNTGDEVLIGDYGGELQGESFEYWTTEELTPGNSRFNFDNTGDTFTQGLGGNDLGWTQSMGPQQAAGFTAHHNHSNNTGLDDTTHQEGRIEFLAGGGSGDDFVWDTATDGFYGGGGLTQTVSTAAGSNYDLTVNVTDASIATEDTVLEVHWDGSVIATRSSDGAGGNTWTGTAPTESTDGTTSTWTFAGLNASTAGTELSLISYEQYGPPDGAGDSEGLVISGVGLAAVGVTDNADTINGGDGADLIFGQGGNDSLTGGNGTDTFVYSMTANNGADIITDFVAGDQIQLVNVHNETGAATTLAEGATTDNALTFDDLMTGSQVVTVSNEGGNVKLNFGDGTTIDSLGSVVLTGLAYDTSNDTVQELLGSSILDMTTNGFHTGL